MHLERVEQGNSRAILPRALKPKLGLFKTALVACAFALGLGAVSEAHATPRCTSKPAACDLMKAREAKNKPPKKSSSAPAVKPQRCLSKPAVCALQKAREGEPRPQRLANPKIEHCTSKPAACDLQRSRARIAAKQKQAPATDTPTSR